MTVDQVYRLIQYIINKQQTGDLAPDEFNLIMPQAERSYLAFLLGNPEQYQYGRQVARIELGMNQPVLQRLAPFIAAPSTLTVSSGLAAYPANFEAVVAMYTSDDKRIRFVQQDSLYSYKNSVIDPVASNPIYLIQADGFLFYPSNISNPKISFVRTPTFMQWGYTLDGNGRPVYDAGTSTQPEWYEVDLMQIIARALQMVGVNLQDASVAQYAAQLKNQGQ
jgi:hypothetical protein